MEVIFLGRLDEITQRMEMRKIRSLRFGPWGTLVFTGCRDEGGQGIDRVTEKKGYSL